MAAANQPTNGSPLPARSRGREPDWRRSSAPDPSTRTSYASHKFALSSARAEAVRADCYGGLRQSSARRAGRARAPPASTRPPSLALDAICSVIQSGGQARQTRPWWRPPSRDTARSGRAISCRSIGPAWIERSPTFPSIRMRRRKRSRRLHAARSTCEFFDPESLTYASNGVGCPAAALGDRFGPGFVQKHLRRLIRSQEQTSGL